jgi:dihydrofolate synthase/folylpolyglutamate synthase
MELLFDDPPVILDGAHNPAGMEALVESIKQLWSDKDLEKMIVIYASMKDKDYPSSLKLLASLNSKIYCTEIPDNERSAKSSDIREELLHYLSKDRISTFCNPRDALLAALKIKQPVLICGSLYLVSFIKNTIRAGL